MHPLLLCLRTCFCAFAVSEYAHAKLCTRCCCACAPAFVAGEYAPVAVVPVRLLLRLASMRTHLLGYAPARLCEGLLFVVCVIIF